MIRSCFQNWLAVIIASAVTFAPPASAQSVQQAFSDCRTSKDLGIKVSACTFVIQNSKNKSYIERAHNSRGLGYMALDDYRKAVSDFSSAFSYDRKNSGYLDNRQGAYFALGDYRSALNDAELAVHLSPSEAFVYRSRGAIFSQLGKYQNAIDDFSTAIRLDPSWIDLLVYRAIALREQGRTELAVADLNQAILLKSDLFWGYEERGVTYLRIGAADKAKNDLELVLQHDPSNTRVREYLRSIDAVPRPSPSDNQVPAARTPKLSASAEIPLQKEGGTYVVPVFINNVITLNFVVDSGASDVSLPADVVSTLFRTGSLKETDFIGTQTYRLADGSQVPSRTFHIRSLVIGGKLVENVTGSIAPAQGDLLLGQSFLSRFRSWSIDNARQTLVLKW